MWKSEQIRSRLPQVAEDKYWASMHLSRLRVGWCLFTCRDLVCFRYCTGYQALRRYSPISRASSPYQSMIDSRLFVFHFFLCSVCLRESSTPHIVPSTMDPATKHNNSMPDGCRHFYLFLSCKIVSALAPHRCTQSFRIGHILDNCKLVRIQIMHMQR